ncbi:uncharacterized protein [Rutidosis leptorrhynchoides]|uniref:uncharacterized protein n=1 Tax=Rutidosis leptorrhynchoides TaxID=125765 RepID=UPI003A99DB2C
MRAGLQPGPCPNRTIRNSLVPLKVELFIWRARQFRLPTRVELNKRGMDLGSIRCPLCDDDLETAEHSVFRCKVAFETWVKVFNWWNIWPMPHLLMAVTFLGNGLPFCSSVGKQLWQATEWVTGYMLWKNRNVSTFTKSKPTEDIVFKEIQLKTFEWISNRSRKVQLDWDIWINNPHFYESHEVDRSGIG